MMENKEVIAKRCSRRTFKEENLSDKTIEDLTKIIDEINAESGLSFKLVEDGSKGFDGFKSYGMFKNVRTVVVLKGGKGIAHLKEKVGYFGEKFVLEATKKDLGTCWVGGTYKENAEWSQEDEEIACVIVVGYSDEKLDLKEKLIRRTTHLKKKSLQQLCEFDKVETWFIEAMKAVQQAPSAVNGQPVYFTLKNDVISVKLNKENKYTLIDLGIAKYHFELISGIQLPLGNPAVVKRDSNE